jgi:hypothetical protein
MPARRDSRELVQPPAVQLNARRIVAVGTLLWFIAFLALVPFYSSLGHHHHRVWLWTCLAGTICGLAGWSLMIRHRRLGRTI